MEQKRLARRDVKRPGLIHSDCDNCNFYSGACIGWTCATLLAQRLPEYEDNYANDNKTNISCRKESTS